MRGTATRTAPVHIAGHRSQRNEAPFTLANVSVQGESRWTRSVPLLRAGGVQLFARELPSITSVPRFRSLVSSSTRHCPWLFENEMICGYEPQFLGRLEGESRGALAGSDGWRRLLPYVRWGNDEAPLHLYAPSMFTSSECLICLARNMPDSGRPKP